MLENKTVVIGVSGGIAVYKVCDLVSRLKKLNAKVHVIMTRSATEFVSPLTFQSLSQNYVVVDMFEEPKTWDVEHIAIAKKADIFVVAPATANVIGKIKNGIADDMLTTTIMATQAPVLMAPAMNTNMYLNPIVQENIKYLRERQYKFVEPESGRLACGDLGVGKLADNDRILKSIKQILLPQTDFKDKNILITAGPTREWIDPVRYISNPSSGKMGYALAQAAIERGAKVTLVSGPVTIDKPKGLYHFTSVETANEMYETVMTNLSPQDIIIKTAAVSDYRPKDKFENKVKKDKVNTNLELISNPDILYTIGKNKKEHQFVVGFAAETNNIIEEGMKKLIKKQLDLIVVNDIQSDDAGFQSDTNIVTLIDKNKNIREVPKVTKATLSHIILDEIVKIQKG
ncbi:phosphopantothenoylcysteine decarboxylase/phosphopantothenate--cysteine ligase [Natranaerovirga hydrolytica]|uniref:Coenzyme A biosynthesis bifunctional protein CoaBC n=1 Tax=Natranaerovirga hydrolytica TaxID=680378 RepID=A0A4R1MDS3_9FIRM|nr:bifunctional phosphopantothenoylcysteine decarboxylase/phosphopantothenate--cysteine ligase CoaBC [Natranaerovirga hydrolytica]TCK88003.1 phosphopantothenoylcysteine decarboxylase/phosphopantothenate--cysteine ligase [Natranaerovirga hydrolytica]